MWNRIKRLFRALFGWMISGAEDSEMMLRQIQDDIRNKLPRMNDQVAEVVKLKKMLEMQRDSKALELQRLKPMIEAAVKAGESKKAVAMSLIAENQTKTQDLADIDASLATATANAESAMKARVAYEQKVHQQMQECQRQIGRVKMAQMQTEMASLMGSFEVGDDSDELKRITEQVDEKLARAQARQDVASTSVEGQIAEVQADAAALQVGDIYQEYQRSFGIAVAEDAVDPEKTMESIPVATEGEDIKWVEPMVQK